MEGYIQLVETKPKKMLSFKSLSGKKKPPKSRTVWAVLHRQTLQYYDFLDLKAQLPVNLIDEISIKECSVKKLDYGVEGVKYGFKLLSPTEEVLATIETGEPTQAGSWMAALTKAGKLHTDEQGRTALRSKYCEVLGLDPNETLSQAIINRGYKKASLKAHPDRGGNAELFDQVKEACEKLLSMQQYDDDWDEFKVEKYAAVIEKLGDGIGLGIDVQEDSQRGEILVKHLDSSIKIHRVDPPTMEKIKAWDVLIGIDNDDCTGWYLSRVKARLNNFRVPVGSKVTLRFKRSSSGGSGGRKKKEEEEEKEWEERNAAEIAAQRSMSSVGHEAEFSSTVPVTTAAEDHSIFSWMGTWFAGPSNSTPQPSSKSEKDRNESKQEGDEYAPMGRVEESNDDFFAASSKSFTAMFPEDFKFQIPDFREWASNDDSVMGPTEHLDSTEPLPWFIPTVSSSDGSSFWTGVAVSGDAAGREGDSSSSSSNLWLQVPPGVMWYDVGSSTPAEEQLFQELLVREDSELADRDARIGRGEGHGVMDRGLLDHIRTNPAIRERPDLAGSLQQIEELRREELRWKAKKALLEKEREDAKKPKVLFGIF